MIKKIIAVLFYKVINSAPYLNLIRMQNEKKISEFKKFGKNSYLPDLCTIKNPQYISIGKNFSSLYNLRIEAWDAYENEIFQPEIIIGDNVNLNSDCHIGCIDKVIIGDNVLIGSKVYISDHSHGEISKEALLISPVHRKLHSKGPVIIGNNVWVGENVAILPGVTIGLNSIIGANAVVTRDIPANSVVGGNPARIIKTFS